MIRNDILYQLYRAERIKKQSSDFAEVHILYDGLDK